MKLNKKGQGITVIVIVIIVLFAFSFMTFFSYQIYDEIAPSLNESLSGEESKQALMDSQTSFPSTFDAIIVMILFLFWIFLIISSFMSDDHPIMFVFMIIIGTFICIAGMILGNFYEEMFADESLSSLTTHFPMSHWILTHMLIICLIFVFSIMFGVYGKNIVR